MVMNKQPDKTQKATKNTHSSTENDLAALNREILLLRQQVNQLKQQAHTDTLTGIFNRYHMNHTLEVEIERSYRTLLPTSLLMIDLDYFKEINDKHGHLIGDQALCHIANIINRTIRKLDTACRFGGEEFAVILPSTHICTAVQVAERLRKNIADSSLIFEHEQRDINLTASFGVASFSEDGNERADTQEILLALIAKADKQLYRAKGLGRNNVCCDQNVEKASTNDNALLSHAD